MTWLEKQAELLLHLQVAVEEKDWSWLTTSVDLDAPDLEDLDTAVLRERFTQNRKLNKARLTRTYIWQAWLKVQTGEIEPVHGNVRSFWYQYLEGFYRSHGLFESSSTDSPPDEPLVEIDPTATLEVLLDGGGSRGRSSEAKVCAAMTELFTDFVEHHIFRYQGEFGFSESLQSKYVLGRDRAKYIFYTEKIGLWDFCNQINKTTAAGRSITVMASHGESSYQKVEYLAEQLKAEKVGELVIGAMCDYDPWGFWIAWNFDHKLSSISGKEKDKHGKLKPYFSKVTTYLLTTADLFTPAQIKKNGRDLSGSPDQALINTWLKVTHGIHGKPIALHLDVIPERMRRQRVDNWLEDMIDHMTPPFPTVPKVPPKASKNLALGNVGFDDFLTRSPSTTSKVADT